ncbi:family 43 glycosylhydrolase [Curtobacterium sp. PhB136]|uniref:family 43 glycosylhydrolase n=1 Tax=Curtobacterium sp. PhB136 TaxID=2485181 RepID=UPI0010453AAD|nr:family 43 glycosylhydrolase [Curtobacterium sp. PhB136]TCK59247.1 glycosyl hydrolase family 43 [Curtobacterium sp. PhB136]
MHLRRTAAHRVVLVTALITGITIAAPALSAAADTTVPASSTDSTTTAPAPDRVRDDLGQLSASVAALDAGDFTIASWRKFAPVRTTAAAIAASDADAATRTAAYDRLRAAKQSLVDVSGLRQDVVTYGARQQSDHTPESWRPFTLALHHARSLLKAVGPSARAVVAAKDELLAAAGRLATIDQGTLGTIRNDEFWKDTDGNPIYSQGGGVFRFGDTYYWYGVKYTGAVKYYENPTNLNADTVFDAITVYSSQDLVHWKFENEVATPETPVYISNEQDPTPNSFSKMDDLGDTSWLGRLGVTYNEHTGKYTIISQMGNKYGVKGTDSAELFLQSDSPTGDFHYAAIQIGIQGIAYQSTGDQTVFTDDDGSDYLVYSKPSGRETQFVSKISDADSLSIGAGTQIGSVPAGREGNTMFKANGHYYVASSDLHGWNASTTHIIRSVGDSITGPYTADAVLDGSQQDYSHVSQSGFFVTVHGTTQDTVVYAGDRWSDFAWNGLGYNVWEPLTIDADGTPHFNSFSEWGLNATTGAWQVGAGNNVVRNPDFDADRVSVPSITGWTTTADPGTTNAAFVTNSTPGADNSRWSGKLRSAAPFSGALSQTDSVPAGDYRLTFTSQVTGTLDHARVRVTGADGTEYSLDLADGAAGWTDRTLDGIRLPAGAMTIRFEAGGTGSANALLFDSIRLVRTEG